MTILTGMIKRGMNCELELLSEWCRENSKKEDAYHILHAFHCSQWEEYLSNLIYVKEEIVSKSTFTFYFYSMFNQMDVNNLKTMEDFGLLVFQKKWVHTEFIVPVLGISMGVLIDALKALEWHVLCDHKFKKRTVVWYSQVKELLELLRSRASEFIQKNDWDLETLDAEDGYVYQVPIETGDADAAAGGYESDEELFNRNKSMYFDFSFIAEKTYGATFKFIIFCDSIFTELDKAIKLKECTELQEVEGGMPSLDKFRGWLFQQVSQVREEVVITARADWYLKLYVTEAMIRQFKYERGFNQNINLYNILMCHNEDLIEPRVSSMIEFKTRPVFDVEYNIRINTDAFFNYVSPQYGDVVNSLVWFSVYSPCPWRDNYIYHERIGNDWIVVVSEDEKIKTPSLTHAFVCLRAIQREERMGNIVRGCDCSLLDFILF